MRAQRYQDRISGEKRHLELEGIFVQIAAQEATARTARKLFPLLDAANDQPTADLLTQRLEVHEKTAWMLRSLLED